MSTVTKTTATTSAKQKETKKPGSKSTAKKNTKTPTIIEFIIDPEEMVYPMVKPGGTLADLIMDC